MLDIRQSVEKPRMKEKIPNFQVGDMVKVSLKIKEKIREGERDKKKGSKEKITEREKIYPFQGIVIKRKGGGIRETFTVRKDSYGIGVERIFPLHSPIISEIRVLKKGNVKRAKLYYLRNKKEE
ncbi:MAG: 50S ribosomal protein L19 [Candidatus Ratteibacteria bacterium]|nr:50S ribosomal protein L19 [Candidatus Ratteibacteria bacterium]